MSQRASYNRNMDKNWDPMQEAYRDPNFNSYRDGPGANLDLDKQPCSSGSSKEKTMTKLYVGNVSPNITKDGIENMFRLAGGNPIEVIRGRPPATWAFVTFQTWGEADHARRELDRRPPAYLKIQYAKTPEERKRQTDNFEFPSESENPVETRRPLESNKPSGKGRGLAVGSRQRSDSVEERVDIRQFQPYGGSNYDESNAAIMKGVQRDSGPGGPRKFVMGRGCYDREMDQICQPKNLGEVADNVQEAKNSIENYYQRRNGMFEYSKKEYPPNWVQGTCTYCKEPSTQYCEQCKDWYCSRTCQEKDWPRHRAYCGKSSGKNQPVTSSGNTNQISPPRKDKGGREFDSQSQNNGYTPLPSNDAISSESRYSKRNDGAKKYNGADSEQKSPESLKSSQSLRNDKKRSPHKNSTFQGKEMSVKKGYASEDEAERSFEKDSKIPSNEISLPCKANDTKFTKKGHQNQFYNGSDQTTSEKEPKNFARTPNENKSSEKFHHKKTMNDHNYNTDRNSTSKPKQTSPSKSNLEKTSKLTSNTEKSPKEKPLEIIEQSEQLSETSFIDVIVQIDVCAGEYWVVLQKNFEEVMLISSETEMQTESAPIELGSYCMAIYDNLWCRAKITSLRPKLKVFFIDFGNEEEYTGEVKMLPDTVKHMKSQAIRIKLAPETSQKYHNLKFGDKLRVMRVHQNKDGIASVHVEGEVYKQMPEVDDSVDEVQPMVEEIPIALQSVVVLLENDMECTASVTEFNNTEFVACLVPTNAIGIYNSLFSSEFQDECESIQSVNFIPKVGEAVVAKFSEEGWLRASVLHVSSKREYSVASCDLGLVEIVKDVKKMPSKCRKIVQFAVQCVVLEENKSIDLNCFTGKITIESCTTDKTLAILENNNQDKCKIEITMWETPYELYEELKCVELKSGDCVISAEMSAFELYIRPLSSPCVDIYNRLLQDVAKHCYKSPPLKYVPKVGQVLAAQFTEDGNFYRAIVREVHKLKGVKVQYIDFGNAEYVQPENLKPLDKTLRKIECCVVKVVLKDVADRPLNEPVQKLFKELILGTVTLKVKLSDPENNKVHLYTKDGTDLNEKINQLLIPGWKKGVVDKHIYTISDVEMEELEFDTPLELVIMSVIGKDNEVVVRPKRSKVILVLQNDLQDAIDEYCNNSHEPYTPREMELCVANIDNTWCRCLCLAGGNHLSLYLLDDGRVIDVQHQYIRKYLQEFTALPAVGVRCKIKTNVNSGKKEEMYGHIRTFLTTMKIITATVIGALPDKARLKGYIITVPELDQALKTL